MIGAGTVILNSSTGTTTTAFVHCYYVGEADFPTAQEIQAALDEQRIQSRRTLPGTFVKKPLCFLIVNPLIRWLAKALIGGQK